MDIFYRLVGVGGGIFWVGGGGWTFSWMGGGGCGSMEVYFGWMRVGGQFF